VIVKQDVLTTKLPVMTITLVLMTLVTKILAVFSLKFLVMIMTHALMTLVVLLKDVFTLKKFVTTIIYVPAILAIQKLVSANMCQQTVKITMLALPKPVVKTLVYVYIPLLTVMIRAHVLLIVVLQITVVVILQ
jgi:hypothetical protein